MGKPQRCQLDVFCPGKQGKAVAVAELACRNCSEHLSPYKSISLRVDEIYDVMCVVVLEYISF